MSSIWLFAVSGGIVAVFASLLWAHEMAELFEHKPVRRQSWTPPGLPFWMSEKLLTFAAVSLAVLVVSLTR